MQCADCLRTVTRVMSHSHPTQRSPPQLGSEIANPWSAHESEVTSPIQRFGCVQFCVHRVRDTPRLRELSGLGGPFALVITCDLTVAERCSCDRGETGTQGIL
jgi:hypothetical protein